MFLNDGSADAFTFGLKTKNATANWIAADNFRLTYYQVKHKLTYMVDGQE